MLAELKALKAENAERAAEEAVTLALRSGKLTPPQKDWAKSYALSDPKGFAAFVDKAPQIVPMGEVHFDRTAAPSGDTLNSETLFACKQLGITPEEVKKYGLQEDR